MSVCNHSLLWLPRREFDLCVLGVVFYVYFLALRLREQLAQIPFPVLPLVTATIQGGPPLHSAPFPFSLSPDTFSPKDYTVCCSFPGKKKSRRFRVLASDPGPILVSLLSTRCANLGYKPMVQQLYLGHASSFRSSWSGL